MTTLTAPNLAALPTPAIISPLNFEAILAQGNPSLIAETPVTLTGFKPDIDGSGWLVNEVHHTLGSGGFNSVLALEVKA